MSNDELVLSGYLETYIYICQARDQPSLSYFIHLHLILPLILPLLDFPKHFIYTSSIFYYNSDFYGFISQIKYIKYKISVQTTMVYYI